MARKPKAQVPVSDETLMALADGELKAPEAAALRLRMATDPVLAERFALFVETRHLLAPVPAVAEPVPPALEAAVRRMAAAASSAAAAAPEAPAAGGAPEAPQRMSASESPTGEPAKQRLGVVEGGRSSATAAPARRPLPFGTPLPLAAALVFAIGGAFGALISRVEPPAVATVTASPEGAAALTRALATLPSGDTARFSTRNGIAGEITVIASYRLTDGRLCREYETRFSGAVVGREIAAACRPAGGGAFAPVIAVNEPPGVDGTYAPASGSVAAVDDHLRELGAAAALDPAAERAALRR